MNRLSKAGSAVIAFKQVVRGAAAVIEISSGALNGLLKLTGVKDKYPELYASISEYLFYLECASLSGELSLGLRAALKKSARKTLDNSKGLNNALKENAGDSLLFTAKKNAQIALQETYAAMIHLWEMAGAIVRTLDNFSSKVQLALMELGVNVMKVLDDVNFRNMLPELVQVEIAGFGKIDWIVMSDDMRLLFAGTSKEFDQFAKKITVATEESRDSLIKFLDNTAGSLNLKYKDFLTANGLKIIRRPNATKNLELIDRDGFIRAFGKGRIENYIKLKQRPDLKKIIDDAKQNLKKKSYKYNNKKTPDVPYSANGTAPTFRGMKAYKNGDKLGNGKVPEKYKKQLSEMKRIIEKHDGVIETFVTGSRPADFKNCWRAMGVTDEKLINTYQLVCNKLELTWHHVDDLSHEMTSSFELVTKKLHEATYKHMGSAAQQEEVYRLLNKN